MNNINFLKTLTVLYVEDEELARKSLSRMFSRFFKNILVASDGDEGYKNFKKEQVSNNIDLIISDINMPKLNGIQMLEKIRTEGHNVPIIFLTARTESEYLLKAIELNTSHYVLKPINIEDILKKIKEVCEKKYFENLLEQKNIELEQYTSIIENVAIVYKMKEDKSISYMNPLLKELFGFKNEDFMNMPINNLTHNNFDGSIFDTVWEQVSKDNNWNGDIKFVDTQGIPFFVNSTIFRIVLDEKIEYVSVGFLSTESVNKKRQFHRNVIKTLKDKNIEKIKLKESFEKEKNYSNNLNNLVIRLEEKLKNEQEKRLRKTIQLEYEVEKSNNEVKKIQDLVNNKNNEVGYYKKSIENIENEKSSLFRDYKKIEIDLILANEEINMLCKKLKKKEERLLDLNYNLRDIETKYDKIILRKTK